MTHLCSRSASKSSLSPVLSRDSPSSCTSSPLPIRNPLLSATETSKSRFFPSCTKVSVEIFIPLPRTTPPRSSSDYFIYSKVSFSINFPPQSSPKLGDSLLLRTAISQTLRSSRAVLLNLFFPRNPPSRVSFYSPR